MSSLTATAFFLLGAFSGVIAAVVLASVVLVVLELVDRRAARRPHGVRVPNDASALAADGTLVGHRAA